MNALSRLKPQLRFAFIIFKYFPFGGVQRDMLRIANDCLSAGHDVTIYTGEWRGDLPDALISVQVLPSSGWFNHRRHQSLIRQFNLALQKNPPDVVVGFNRMAGLDIYYAADPCFVARAYEERSWLYRLTGRFKFFADAEKAVMSAQSKTKILLLTAREKVVFQQWYQTPETRFHLLAPNIPWQKFAGKNQHDCRNYARQQFNLPADANIIVTVGSAFVRKGVDRVIDALASLPAEIQQNTWLIAIGEYESNSDLRAYCEKRGITQRCIAAGGRNDIAELMLGADLLAHPARSELAGIVIMEAMTAGLPVLLTDVCGYAPHVSAANAGCVLASPFQQDEMNAALAEMLTSQQRELWKTNGPLYTKRIKETSSATQEADFIIACAIEKTNKNSGLTHLT